MAGYSPTISNEDENFFRVYHLVNRIGVSILRDVYDNVTYLTDLKTIKTQLCDLKRKGFITQPQWDLLFPPDGSTANPQLFDVTLVVLLLRNFGNLGEPRNFQWDVFPKPSAVAVYHDVARLKNYRNKYAHANTGVSDKDFLTDWNDITASVLRLVPANVSEKYMQDIRKLQTLPVINEDFHTTLQIHDVYASKIRDAILNDMKKTVRDEVQDAISSAMNKKTQNTDEFPDDSENKAEYKVEDYVDYVKDVYRKFTDQLSCQSGEVTFDLYMPVEMITVNHPHQQTQSTTNIGSHTIRTTKDITDFIDRSYNPDMFPVFVEGDAGVGKTTLLRWLTQEWTKGSCQELNQFKFIFLIPLRHVHSNHGDLADIICDDLKLLPPSEKNELRRYLDLKMRETLFLVDGLDEKELPDTHALVELMKSRRCQIVFTSRPIIGKGKKALETHVKQMFHVRLFGFSDETLSRFITNYLWKNNPELEVTDVADLILKECRKHIFCKMVVKIPLYAALVCFLWRTGHSNLPSTATELFSCFVKEQLKMFLQRETKADKVEIVFERSPLESSVPTVLRKILICVARLAYATLLGGKVSFSVQEVDNHHISLDEIKNLGFFRIEQGPECTIYFRHKLFHEYFAGLHMSQERLCIEALFTDSFEASIEGKNMHYALSFAAGFSIESYHCISKSVHKLDRPRSRTSSKESAENTSQEQQAVGNLREKYMIKIFLNQVLFETNTAPDCELRPEDIEPIPIYTASAHSMAASWHLIHILQGRNNDGVQNEHTAHVILVDGNVVDLEHLVCILQECSQTPIIKRITLIHAGITLVKEMLKYNWPHVKELKFDECRTYVPCRYWFDKFPNLKVIQCDKNMMALKKIYIPETLSVGGEHTKCAAVAFTHEYKKNICSVCLNLVKPEVDVKVNILYQSRSSGRQEICSKFLENVDVQHICINASESDLYCNVPWLHTLKSIHLCTTYIEPATRIGSQHSYHGLQDKIKLTVNMFKDHPHLETVIHGDFIIGNGDQSDKNSVQSWRSSLPNFNVRFLFTETYDASTKGIAWSDYTEFSDRYRDEYLSIVIKRKQPDA